MIARSIAKSCAPLAAAACLSLALSFAAGAQIRVPRTWPQTTNPGAAKQPGPAAARAALPQLAELPKLSAGAPQNVQAKTDWQKNPESLRQFQNPSLVQLRGLGGLKEAKDLPQVATDLLVLHARTLPAEELDSYIVNPQLAAEWLKKHPLPPEFVASVRKKAMAPHRACRRF